MSTSPQNARKEMFARLNTCWQAGAAAIVGSVPEIRFQGVAEPQPPAMDGFFARCSTQGVDTKQSAFIMATPGASPAEFTSNGVLIIQVFAPMVAKTAYAKGELLAALAQGAFMAYETASGVWFRRPRIIELDNDGTWYRWNVFVDYQFDQIKGN